MGTGGHLGRKTEKHRGRWPSAGRPLVGEDLGPPCAHPATHRWLSECHTRTSARPFSLSAVSPRLDCGGPKPRSHVPLGEEGLAHHTASAKNVIKRILTSFSNCTGRCPDMLISAWTNTQHLWCVP